MLRLFQHLVMSAATETNAIYEGLYVGQIKTTYQRLAEALWCWDKNKKVVPSRRQINRMLNKMSAEEMLTVAPSPAGLLITVINYEMYQGIAKSESSLRAPIDPSWTPDPLYDYEQAMEKWIEVVGTLPHRVNRASATNALALLHLDDHYSAADIYRVIEQLNEHRQSLGWVIGYGPERLRRRTSGGDATMDVVLKWTSQKEFQNGKKRKLYSGLGGGDAINKAAAIWEQS